MHLTISLMGTTPLLMHNPRMVDKTYEINRLIAAITNKRKKTDEDYTQIERLEWYGGLYDHNGVVVQPTSKVRKCLIESARIQKLGKGIERGVVFSDLHVPLEHDGPADIDAIFAQPRFHSRLSVGVGKKRVMRVRPQFFPWGLTVRGLFIPDVGVNVDELHEIVRNGGISIGIGDNRVNGYGRFEAKVVVS